MWCVPLDADRDMGNQQVSTRFYVFEMFQRVKCSVTRRAVGFSAGVTVTTGPAFLRLPSC